MTDRLEVIADRERFNRIFDSHDIASIDNSWGWGEARRSLGWHPLRCIATIGGHAPIAFSIHTKKIPLVARHFAIIPGAIPGDLWSQADWASFFGLLRRFGARSKFMAVALNYALPSAGRQDLRGHLLEAGFKPSCLIPSSGNTIIIATSASEEALFGALRKNHRYRVRKAQRSGASIRCAQSVEEALDFFGIHERMCRRKGISILRKGFFVNLWSQLAVKEKRLRLFLCHRDGRLLGGALVSREPRGYKLLYCANEATAPDISRFIQWEIIRDVRNRGLDYYDLYGFPKDAGLLHGASLRRRHGMAFWKLGFGGTPRELVGAVDVVCDDFLYAVFSGFRIMSLQGKLKARLGWAWRMAREGAGS